MKEVLCGLEEGGSEGVARHYSSVACDDRSGDISVARLDNIGVTVPSGANSPVDERSIEGSGTKKTRQNRSGDIELQNRDFNRGPQLD